MMFAALIQGLRNAQWAAQITFTLIIPIFLLAHKLPHRKTSLVRGIIGIATVTCICVAPVASGIITGLTARESFFTFAVLLAIFAVLIGWVYDCGPWPALFCATAGYTIQNMGSGLQILAATLISGRSNGVLPEPLSLLVTTGVLVAVYSICYIMFIKKVGDTGLTQVKDRSMLFMFIIVVFIIIGFDLVIKSIIFDGIRYNYLVFLRLVHTAICSFVLFAEYEILFARRMSNEKAETERLLAERQRQYQISHKNIEAINIKCHDIRHQIRHYANGSSSIDKAALADIAREVNVYDAVVETGNEALNTILTEKNLACSSENITLACIADGSSLNFMSPSDIYTFFGNALDNAIEAVRQIEDPEKRSITLNVIRRGNMVAINIENFFRNEPHFKNGSLVTSKHDEFNHGFGVKSMELIAERYGGSLHVGTTSDVFYLNVLLAIPAT